MVNIRKKEQFSAFIKYLEDGAGAHWIQVAQALNVDKDTISVWRKDPRAKKAVMKGIAKALREMEKSGSNDWRMWESKLRLLGVSPTDKTDITSEGKHVAGFIMIAPDDKVID